MPGSVDVESAVARIAAAADSLDALSMAIEKAAFLDNHPGEGRQKLRGNQGFCLCRLERLVHWYQPHFCSCMITTPLQVDGAHLVASCSGPFLQILLTPHEGR